MSKVKFIVEIEVSGEVDVTAEQVITIASGVAWGIVHEVDSRGLVPDSMDEYTKAISVKDLSDNEIASVEWSDQGWNELD